MKGVAEVLLVAENLLGVIVDEPSDGEMGDIVLAVVPAVFVWIGGGGCGARPEVAMAAICC